MDQYAATIQTTVVQQKGQEHLFLLARSAYGIDTYRLDQTQQPWELLALSNPPWSDNAYWNQESAYLTVQTTTISRNGQDDDLYLLGCQGGFIEMYQFDFSLRQWVHLREQRLSWPWVGKEYTSTLQTAVVRLNGNNELLLLGRTPGGIDTYHFDRTLNPARWVKLDGNNPDFSDVADWKYERYYATIQMASVQRKEQDELFLLARSTYGLDTFQFNHITRRWDFLVQNYPAWTDEAGWNRAFSYKTIQTQVVKQNGQNAWYLIGRSPTKLETYQFDFALSR